MDTELFRHAVTKFFVGFILLGYIPIIALRIRNEEQVLTRQLAGYPEYRQKVRWKVIPFVR